MTRGRSHAGVWVIGGVLGGLYFLLAFHPIWDIDVFWHIRTGQWIIENLTLPTTDIFSAVDPDRKWRTFQWFYEVLVFLIDEAGGLTAVRLLHAAVAAAGIALIAVVWARPKFSEWAPGDKSTFAPGLHQNTMPPDASFEGRSRDILPLADGRVTSDIESARALDPSSIPLRSLELAGQVNHAASPSSFVFRTLLRTLARGGRALKDKISGGTTGRATSLDERWFAGACRGFRESGVARGLAAAAVLAFLFADRLRVRPDVFNLLFFAILMTLLVHGKRSWSFAVAMGGLAALWANTHAGGALLLPVFLCGTVAGRVVELLLTNPRTNRNESKGRSDNPKAVGYQGQSAGNPRGNVTRQKGRWSLKFRTYPDLSWEAGCLVICSVLMLVMPGFVSGAVQAFVMLGPSEKFIPEWISTWEFLFKHARSPHEYLAGVGPLIGLVALGVRETVRALRGGSVPPSFVSLALSLPAFYLAALHVRFLWLGAVPWLCLLYSPRRVQEHQTPNCHMSNTGQPGNWSLRPLSALTGPALFLLAVMVLATDVHYHVWRNEGGVKQKIARLGVDLEPGEFPERAANFLVESNFAGRVLNHAPWGGYLLYRLGPGSTVLTDGRGNFTDLEDDILAGMERRSTRKSAIEKASRAARLDAIVHPDPFPFRNNDTDSWVLAYHDAESKVYLNASRKELLASIIRMTGPLPERARGMSKGPIRTEKEERRDFQRRMARFWGERRLASGEKSEEIAMLKARAATGEPGALEQLAATYFELELYERTIELLKASQAYKTGDPRATVLLILAYRANADPERADELCATLPATLSRMDSRTKYIAANACQLTQQ